MTHLSFPSSIFSGKYTISFIVEGDNAGLIKPLIFPIVVTSSSVRCGIPHAIDKLEGVSYLDSLNRHALVGRREILSSIEQVHSELEAVRALLLILYLALPSGALSGDANTAANTNGDSFALITEPAAWNDVLDQAWRGAVFNATTPLQLLECVLLLEYYINKQWLAYPQSRILAALPNPHFAVCNATYSSSALRIYCLDKALLYDKVFVPPRERRAAQFDQFAYEEPPVSKYSQSTNNSTSDGRGRRAAAASASLRIQKSVNYNEDSGDEGPNVTTTSVQPPQKWACPECTMVNEARARSCAGCEARKPTAGSAAAAAAAREARDREAGGGRSGRTSGRAAAAVASRCVIFLFLSFLF